MANLTHGGTSLTTGASWEALTTQTSQAATYTFATAEKYVDQNIDLKVTAQNWTTSNITTSTATTAIPIVSVRGWAPTTSISGITMAASKTLNITDSNNMVFTMTTDSSGNIYFS